MVLHEIEFPLARQVKVAGTLALVVLGGKVSVLIGEVGGACLLAVLLIHLRVEPHLRFLCAHAHSNGERTQEKHVFLHKC